MAKIADHMAYIVVRDHPGGAFIPEQNVGELDRKAVAKDIADGQHDDLIQVLEINPVEGTCRDVTADIAMDVSSIWTESGEPLQDWQRDFIEKICGFEVANAFPRAA